MRGEKKTQAVEVVPTSMRKLAKGNGACMSSLHERQISCSMGFFTCCARAAKTEWGKSQNRGDLDCFKIKCYMEMCSEDAGWHRGELFLSACWPE